MPNRVNTHPSDGHLLRRIHGCVADHSDDDVYRIEPEQGQDGQWVSAEECDFVEIKR
jgi:hypothetical protein